MATSAEILNLDQLLEPISADSPCGESLRWEPVWDELNQLRRTRKDPLHPSADRNPEWGKVIALATELLTTRTKDLLIAGWLTEALVREHGFAGFRDGLRLIRGLVEQFWDNVHPQMEDDDLSIRAAPFSWLTSRDGGAHMPAALREIPLARSSDGELYNWNYWHARNAAPIGKDEDVDQYERRCAEALSYKQSFDSAVSDTPPGFYRDLYSDMEACLAEIDRLALIVDERLGDLAPGWSDLRHTIAEIQVFVRDVLQRRGSFAETTSVETVVSEAAPAVPATESTSMTTGPIRTRGEAVTRLEEVATFFSNADPHSPVAYLIRRAIRWSNMSLEELLAELVKDESTLRQIEDTLGTNGRDNS